MAQAVSSPCPFGVFKAGCLVAHATLFSNLVAPGMWPQGPGTIRPWKFPAVIMEIVGVATVKWWRRDWVEMKGVSV